MVSCAICKLEILRVAEKVVCESCDCSFHMSCANVGDDLLQALVENSVKWACGQCVKRKRLTRAASEARPESGGGAEGLNDLRHFLEKLRDDMTRETSKVAEGQKQLEMDLGKTMEACHQKLDENMLLLVEQAKAIEELRGETQRLAEKVKGLSFSTVPPEETIKPTALEQRKSVA